jgi:hypothetical protein
LRVIFVVRRAEALASGQNCFLAALVSISRIECASKFFFYLSINVGSQPNVSPVSTSRYVSDESRRARAARLNIRHDRDEFATQVDNNRVLSRSYADEAPHITARLRPPMH